MADKLDTLVGFFAVGEKPTGSRDPYALRRAALGLIRIMLKSDIRLPIRAAVRDWYRALKTYAAPGRAVYASAARTTGWLGVGWDEPGGAMETYLDELEAALTSEAAYVIAVDEDRPVDFDRTAIGARAPSQPVIYRFRAAREVAEEVTAFLIERLKVLLRDQGARHDLVDAVFALGDDDLVRITRRIAALSQFLATPDGANLLAAYKRASNILAAEAKKGAAPVGTPVAQVGAPREETALIQALSQALPKVERALEGEDFAAAMRALAALRAPVDAFFDKVLVNSDKADERQNRLKLLGEVRALMGQVADFSQVSG
jgi:glycyl-tRNA synthetase beta chain